eukprot:766355-Hanusia_phi.AAC.4
MSWRRQRRRLSRAYKLAQASRRLLLCEKGMTTMLLNNRHVNLVEWACGRSSAQGPVDEFT